MNHIVESIGKWGTRITPFYPRINQVRPGDIVEIPDELMKYPCNHKYSRIASISKDGVAHICEDMGSAYLGENGSCDISGGPWWGMPIDLLKPTGNVRSALYWNWGKNLPGYNQGVYYNIERPVHRITVHPNNIRTRWGAIERDARAEWPEERLGPEWTVHKHINDTWIFLKS